jgi:predicted O-linked N-acetylglucosamine transferase (SPINDLY family)
LALHLARDAGALSAIKAKLARNRTTHALFDTARFTRNLEKAFTRMVERHQNAIAPQSFAVEDAS